MEGKNWQSNGINLQEHHIPAFLRVLPWITTVVSANLVHYSSLLQARSNARNMAMDSPPPPSFNLMKSPSMRLARYKIKFLRYSTTLIYLALFWKSLPEVSSPLEPGWGTVEAIVVGFLAGFITLYMNENKNHNMRTPWRPSLDFISAQNEDVQHVHCQESAQNGRKHGSYGCDEKCGCKLELHGHDGKERHKHGPRSFKKQHSFDENDGYKHGPYDNDDKCGCKCAPHCQDVKEEHKHGSLSIRKQDLYADYAGKYGYQGLHKKHSLGPDQKDKYGTQGLHKHNSFDSNHVDNYGSQGLSKYNNFDGDSYCKHDYHGITPGFDIIHKDKDPLSMEPMHHEADTVYGYAEEKSKDTFHACCIDQKLSYRHGCIWDMLRLIGGSFIVPFEEELFYHSWLYRYIIKLTAKDKLYHCFLDVSFQEWNWMAWLTCNGFWALYNGHEWKSYGISGLLSNWVIARRGQFMDGIIAYSIRNLTISYWVLCTGQRQFW